MSLPQQLEKGHEVNWRYTPRPPFIADHTSPVEYIQDITKSDNVDRTQLDQESSTQAQTNYIFSDLEERSVMWPVSSLKEGCYLPYAVAALTSFYLIPMWIPRTGIGAALTGGYAAGAATFYVKNSSSSQ